MAVESGFVGADFVGDGAGGHPAAIADEVGSHR